MDFSWLGVCQRSARSATEMLSQNSDSSSGWDWYLSAGFQPRLIGGSDLIGCTHQTGGGASVVVVVVHLLFLHGCYECYSGEPCLMMFKATGES